MRMLLGLRRTTLAVALAIATTVAGAVPAAAETRCSYDRGANRVRLVVASNHRVELYRRDGKIYVWDLTNSEPQGCGAATVWNTDSIVVVAASPGRGTLGLRTGSGRLAPGATEEPDGISEIEIRLRGVARLHLISLRHGEHVVAGENGVNLNDDRDADVRGTDDLRWVDLQLNDGDDFVSGQGGHGTGGAWKPPRGGSLVAQAFGGSDTLLGSNGPDLFLGEDGADTLIGHLGADELHGDEKTDVVRGGPGADIVTGGSHVDRLYGGPGNDALFADDEIAEVLHGGDGEDYAGIDNHDEMHSIETFEYRPDGPY